MPNLAVSKSKTQRKLLKLIIKNKNVKTTLYFVHKYLKDRSIKYNRERLTIPIHWILESQL